MTGLSVLFASKVSVMVIGSIFAFWLMVAGVFGVARLASWATRRRAEQEPPEDHRLALNDNYGLRD